MKSRIQLNSRVAGAFAAVVVVAFLAIVYSPDEGVPTVEGEPSSVETAAPQAAALSGVVRNEVELDSPSSSSDGIVGRLVGPDGATIAVDGDLLRFSAGTIGGEGLPVSEGGFTDESGASESIFKLADTGAFLFVDSSGVSSRPTSMRWVDVDESRQELILEMPGAFELAIEVTDLRGDPVSGAEIRIASPVSLSLPRALSTGSDGMAVARIRSADDEIRVRVHKDGYVGFETVISRSGSQGTLGARLHRVLGVGVIVDVRYRMFAVGGFPDGVDVTLPGVDWFDLTSDIESGAALEPYEMVSWTIFGEGESWLEDGLVPVRIKVLGEYVGKLEVPILHLGSPSVELVRPPNSLVNGITPFTEVVVRIEPESAFLASPPEWYWMSWRVMSSNPPEFVGAEGGPPDREFTLFGAPGRHLGGNRFKFWLPESTLAPKSTLNKKSRTQQAALFLGGQTISVFEGATEQSVQLASGDRYVGIDLVDTSGIPLDVAAAITVAQLHSPNFVPARSSWPWRQWVRPGNYDVWGADMTEMSALRLARFSWPSDSGISEGTLHVEVDLSAVPGPKSRIR